ncbi:MAG: NADH-quinone oxidoreductase subunit C [Candidatus Eisenbacteria bacterium]
MDRARLAVEKIGRSLGAQAVVETKERGGELTAVIAGEMITKAAALLRDDPDLRYDFLSDLCGVDWPERAERFEVVYHLYSTKHNSRLRLKVRLSEHDPSLPSVSQIWPTANWHEREAYDMFGIQFTGHPDLRRILNPDDFSGFPLRKDFPVR